MRILSLIVSVLALGSPAVYAQPEKRPEPTSLADVKAQQVQETGGCKKLNGVKSDIELDRLTAGRAFYSNMPLEFWIVPDQTTCFKHNQVHRVVLGETKQVLGETQIKLVVSPTSLSTLTDDAPLVMPIFPKLRSYLKDVEPTIKLYYPETKPSDLIMGLELGPIKKTDNWVNMFSTVMPPYHRVAKVVNTQEVTKMISADKPYILDTRHEFFFKKWHLPGAQQHFLKAELKVSGETTEYGRLNSLKESIRLNDLPKDKNAKILIMGQSMLDQGPFYAAYYLRLSGYTNLYYYRGGQEEWNGQVRTLPDGKAPANAPEISWKDLEGKLKSAHVIDTRPEKDFNLWHIKGAISNPYLSSRVPPLKSDDFKKESFDGDQWDTAALPKDKSKPVVFIGRDESDWSAAVATRRALSLGYKNATWYKGGMGEWRSLGYWYRGRFPMEGNGDLPKVLAQAN